MKNPPCSEWKVWRGKEIEGTTQIGVETLFIRDLPGATVESMTPEFLAKISRNGQTARVWFCKEFSDWPLARAIIKWFKTACLEVNHRTVDCVPKDLKATCVLYYKVPSQLKRGDFICAGPAFNDEAFAIGTGASVKPENYLADIRIL